MQALPHGFMGSSHSWMFRSSRLKSKLVVSGDTYDVLHDLLVEQLLHPLQKRSHFGSGTSTSEVTGMDQNIRSRDGLRHPFLKVMSV